MTTNDSIYSQQLTGKQFNNLRDFIYDTCGIKLPDTKKNMVEGRLRKRVKALNFSSYKDYLNYAFNEGASKEQLHLIDAITTNKTDFFREPNHFNLMTNKILPEFERKGFGTTQKLKVWSCASSTGEEPYTLAMVLAEYFGINGNFIVFATDINTDVLAQGKKAVYTEEKAEPIPYDHKLKYMLKSKNRTDKLVRFRPELRGKVKFARNNLKNNEYVLTEQVEIAFCRNVIIYFDTETQEFILNKICSYINPGGFLFMGHSESIHGMRLPIKNYAPTVYLRN